MESCARLVRSHPTLTSVLRANTQALSLNVARIRALQTSKRPSTLLHSRNASTTSHSSSSNSKPIVLEQPDQFRPPSHPQRLVKSRGRTTHGAYNQTSTNEERDTQRHKRYPHTFPNEGTLMHKFLTSRKYHVFITMVRLRSSTLMRPSSQSAREPRNSRFPSD